MIGLGPVAETLLFGILPTLFDIAFCTVLAALAVRRWMSRTPGTLPILGAAAAWITASTIRLVQSVLIVAAPTSAVWDHPAYVAVLLLMMACSFVVAPLLLWGLWSTWRGYDDIRSEPAP